MKKIIFSAMGVFFLFTCISWGNGDPLPISIINNDLSLGNPLDSTNMILRPNGPGSLTQLGHTGDTTNWKCVDDVTPDDDATYVDKWGSSVSYDLYTLSDFTGNGIINSITLNIRCDYEGGGAFAYPQVRVDGATYGGGEMQLEDWWATYSYTWTKNPKTNQAWTPNDLNALEAGVGLYAWDDPRSIGRCTQVYILVAYTPANNSASILRPNGPGSMTQLGHNGDTPNWKCVDDVTPDEDATYVVKWGSSVSYDLYTLSDFTGSGIINSITINIRCDYEGGGAFAYPQILVDGVTYGGGEIQVADGWATYTYTWTKNPKTNQVWTPNDLNALEAGVGLYAWDEPRSIGRCTQVYVVVDYMSDVPILRTIWPNGGEKLFRGGTYNINWASSGITGNVDITLLKNTGEVFTVAQNISNTGSYSWTIAQNIPSGLDYKIKISGNSGSIYDLSDSFFVISTFSGPTSLFALPSGNNQIYLGWRLSDYRPDIGYNIYRSLTSGSGYTKINSQPIYNSTNYIDAAVSSENRYYYIVRAVEANGFESDNSREVSAIAATQGTNRYLDYTNFVPAPDIYDSCDIKVGDVDGDGYDDFLIAIADTIVPCDGNSCLTGYPTRAIKVMLFNHDGTLLWGPINTYICESGEYPWTLHDLNGDGKDEIIGLKFDWTGQGPPPEDWPLSLVVMNNEGATLSQATNVPHPYPLTQTRINITIAYLDGYNSNIIVWCGKDPADRLGEENLAYDRYCNLIGQYTYETGDPYIGASHMIRAADIDLDGKDEVISGQTVFKFDSDLTVKWRDESEPDKRLGHVDFVEPKDIFLDRPGLEILMGSETRGKLCLWGSSGTKIVEDFWGIRHEDLQSRHPQLGWAANVRDEFQGIEYYVIYKAEGGEEFYPYYLLDTEGYCIVRVEVQKPAYSQPIDWDGDNRMELHDEVIGTLLNPPISGHMHVIVADVIGDYREEIIILEGGYTNEPLTGNFYVYTNTTLNTQRKQSPWTNRLYSESKKRTGYRD